MQTYNMTRLGPSPDARRNTRAAPPLEALRTCRSAVERKRARCHLGCHPRHHEGEPTNAPQRHETRLQTGSLLCRALRACAGYDFLGRICGQGASLWHTGAAWHPRTGTVAG
jgi:hypothetical protein